MKTYVPFEEHLSLKYLAKKVYKEFPLINYGGCGVFALYVQKALREKGYKEIKVRMERSIFYNFEKTESVHTILTKTYPRSFIHINEDHQLFFQHLIITFKSYDDEKKKLQSYYYDAEIGVLPYSQYKKRKSHRVHLMRGSLTSLELESLVERPYEWNTTFDRKNIPRLRKIINQYI